MNLSDKRKKLFNAYKMRNIPTSLILLIQEQDKEFIKALKEELVCPFCKRNPSYRGTCTECFNAGIKIDELAGKELT